MLMASYKVIQDIEAEDKLLGPLTFRQFVYALFCVGFLFLTWFIGSRGGLFLAPMFLFPALVAGFFAFPWRRDQPTELWALAKIRFLLKPRKRIWNQSGSKELVTITAPKRRVTYTRNLSTTEVRSRLSSLASTLDTRGWAIKGAMQPALAMPNQTQVDSDRLVDAEPIQPQIDDTQADDIFDDQNNPRAQRMRTLVDESTKSRRQKVIDEMEQASQTAQPATPNNWFLDQPQSSNAPAGNAVTFNTQVVAPVLPPAPNIQTQPQTTPTSPIQAPAPPSPPIDEDALVKELRARKQEAPMQSYYSHLRNIMPLAEQQKANEEAAKIAAARATQEAAQASRQQPKPSPKHQAALRQLAGNDDFNISTIAREAQRSDGDGEVVIQLH